MNLLKGPQMIYSVFLNLKKYTLLLLVVAALSGPGCSSVSLRSPSPYREAGPTRGGEPLVRSVVRCSYGNGHGTAFAFARDGEDTLLATAAHVAKALDPGSVFELDWYDGRSRRYAQARVAKIHETLDVAILRTNEPLPLLTLADRRQEVGTLVLAIGYGRDIFPPMVTIGRFFADRGDEIFHTSGIWFGFSGGPALDYTSGYVIGINVRIYGDREGPFSNRAGAVDVECLKALAKEL